MPEIDALAGQRLKELEDAGLVDDTLVWFYGDRGSGGRGVNFNVAEIMANGGR